MVKIAIASGSGQVGQEIVDTLAAKKHQIKIFTRSAANHSIPGVTWRVVDYHDKSELIEAWCGIHTVLSFMQPMADPDETAQKNLIDAAIVAGVKRFAPSNGGDKLIRLYIVIMLSDRPKVHQQEYERERKILEYTLFQPGLFLNYKTAKHLEPLNTMIDFQNRCAIVVDGYDAIMTFTTVQDLAAVVAKAVELNGKWPITGGISGNRMSISQILQVGEKIRGRPFTTDKVKLEDLENEILTAPWKLEATHPSVSGDHVEKMLKTVLIGTLLSSAKGAWDVSDEMNKLLPDLKFTQIEDFLTKFWDGKSWRCTFRVAENISSDTLPSWKRSSASSC